MKRLPGIKTIIIIILSAAIFVGFVAVDPFYWFGRRFKPMECRLEAADLHDFPNVTLIPGKEYPALFKQVRNSIGIVDGKYFQSPEPNDFKQILLDYLSCYQYSDPVEISCQSYVVMVPEQPNEWKHFLVSEHNRYAIWDKKSQIEITLVWNNRGGISELNGDFIDEDSSPHDGPLFDWARGKKTSSIPGCESCYRYSRDWIGYYNRELSVMISTGGAQESPDEILNKLFNCIKQAIDRYYLSHPKFEGRPFK